MKKGIGYGILCYLIWGLLPLYWRLFETMSSWEILAHRILWSFVFVAALVSVAKRWKALRSVVADRSGKWAVLACSVIISFNWLLYIWAVNNDHVIEASLGYYINPLISVLFGVIFLRERLLPVQWISILLAGVGVLMMATQYGHFPWIAVSLAVSFALYGLVKKKANMDVLLGLTWETILVLPLSLAFLSVVHGKGTASVASLPDDAALFLLLSGAATALPLFWFAKAAQLLPLSTVGFIQYLSPTTSLLLAVFLFDEPFTSSQLISFSFIWSALLLYSVVTFRKAKAVQRHSGQAA